MNSTFCSKDQSNFVFDPKVLFCLEHFSFVVVKLQGVSSKIWKCSSIVIFLYYVSKYNFSD